MGALDDFMLKILMVCAVLSITIEMIFAEEHRSTGKSMRFGYALAILKFYLLDNLLIHTVYSLDRRIRNLSGCFRCVSRWCLERLAEGRTVY